MPELALTLPWPPSVNSRYVVARNGRRVLARRAREWHHEAVWLVRSQLPRRLQFREPVALTVIAWPPDGRRRDIDNILKATLDALVEAGALADDSLVHELHVLRRGVVGHRRARIEVRVSPL